MVRNNNVRHKNVNDARATPKMEKIGTGCVYMQLIAFVF